MIPVKCIMPFAAFILLISLNLNLHAQGAFSQKELEQRMDPGGVNKLYSSMRQVDWKPDQEEQEKGRYSSYSALTVIYKINRKEYSHVKDSIKHYAATFLTEALKRGCERIIVVVKTGRLFGSHCFSFYLSEFFDERKAE